jgi:hypothetical protein
MTIDDMYKKWYQEDKLCVHCHEFIQQHHPEILICGNDQDTYYQPIDNLEYCQWLEEQKKK